MKNALRNPRVQGLQKRYCPKSQMVLYLGQQNNVFSHRSLSQGFYTSCILYMHAYNIQRLRAVVKIESRQCAMTKITYISFLSALCVQNIDSFPNSYISHIYHIYHISCSKFCKNIGNLHGLLLVRKIRK